MIELNFQDQFSNEKDGKNLEYVTFSSLLGRMFLFHFQGAMDISDPINIKMHANCMRRYFNKICEFSFHDSSKLSIQEMWDWFFALDGCLEELLDDGYYEIYDNLCVKLSLDKDFDISEYLTNQKLLIELNPEMLNSKALRVSDTAFGNLLLKFSAYFNNIYMLYNAADNTFWEHTKEMQSLFDNIWCCSTSKKKLAKHTFLDIAFFENSNSSLKEELKDRNDKYELFLMKLMEKPDRKISTILLEIL